MSVLSMPSTAGSSPAHEPTFSIECLPPNGTVRLRLGGELDLACAADLAAASAHAIGQARTGLLLIDLGDVGLLSLAAARVLIDADRDHRAAGGRVVVQHMPEPVERGLRLCGLHGALEIIDPWPGTKPRWIEPGLVTSPEGHSIGLRGSASPWMVVALLREVPRVADAQGRRVRIDLGDAVVPSGRITAMIGGALRRLGQAGWDVTVIGAPPQLRLLLDVCGDDVTAAER